MKTPPALLPFQAAILLPAAAVGLLLLHWLVVQPAMLPVSRQELPVFVALPLTAEIGWQGSAVVVRVFLTLTAVTALAALALAAVLALRTPEHKAARQLGAALVGGAAASGYFFFMMTHQAYRELLGWAPTAWQRLPMDALAYWVGFCAMVLMARFFMAYPRLVTPEEFAAFALRRAKQAVDGMKARGSWRRHLHRGSAESHISSQSPLGMLQSPWTVVTLAVLALACAGLDWYDASLAPPAARFNHAKFLLGAVGFVLLPVCGEVVANSLHFHMSNALPDDRRKIDWIGATVFSAGIVVVAAGACLMVLGPLALNTAAARGVNLPVELFLVWPLVFGALLFFLALVVALAISVFYRGTIDPRLAARKLTVFGLLGLVVALLFVLLERTLAQKVVALFGLSPDMGALLAGAAVTATIAPIRGQAEKAVSRLASRFLPLDALVEGERRMQVVAMSDLSGYTVMSSHDEKQALLQAALLQRLAGKLVQQHGGRIVKSMGDAVMFAFDDAASAVAVLTALRAEFPLAAQQLGLDALPLHSGAHWGEVTVAHDGDVYGQTVNLAARIQSSAGAHQIVVSADFARAMEEANCTLLGERRFKNVPEPVVCWELAIPCAPASATSAAPPLPSTAAALAMPSRSIPGA